MNIDWNKNIVFNHAITLDNGVDDINHKLLTFIDDIICWGKAYKLKLIDFEASSQYINFKWEGKKEDVFLFFRHYSVNLIGKNDDETINTLKLIIAK